MHYVNFVMNPTNAAAPALKFATSRAMIDR
jgi:hypothetical protein